MTERRDPAIRVVAMPADANAYGDILGGWLLSLKDDGAGLTAARGPGEPDRFAQLWNPPAQEDFIFSFRRFCRSGPLKPAGILGFSRATRNVGYVACVNLVASERSA